MKTLSSALLLSSLVVAKPTRRDTYGPDTSTHMDEVLAGTRQCASTGVLIARETWAPGNIGVLWGARFRDELLQVFSGDVDVQGVHQEDYPARLVDYHIGGSDTGADSCANLLEQYAAKCPDTPIFLSGYRCVLARLPRILYHVY